MSNRVPETILQQLGGHKFKVMTGANKMYGKTNDDGTGYLVMYLPLIRKWVKITLNGQDTYDLDLQRIRGTRITIDFSGRGIYSEQLQACFTLATGLETHL